MMKSAIVLPFLLFSFSLFSQVSKEANPLSLELQELKKVELDSITYRMSFQQKERYLDSLQNAGIIVRKTSSSTKKGCPLEDREEMFKKPEEEFIIFIER